MRGMLDEPLTSSTHPHPSHIPLIHSGSLCQFSAPSHASFLQLCPPPPLFLPPLYSASFLSVTAFDLGTSIKANLTRHGKVTCTQGGQGEVVFMPRGVAASVPEDCRQCDKDGEGVFSQHIYSCMPYGRVCMCEFLSQG